MTEKSVRFKVDGTQAESYMQRMRQSAGGLAREMITASQGMNRSGKEMLQDIESQIKAIERRNSLYYDIQKGEASGRLGAGDINQQQYEKTITGLGGERDEDRLQTQLLRELIDTVKITSKSEIREDRGNVESQLRAFRDSGGIDEDEFETLKRSLQEEELGGPDGDGRRGGGRGGAGAIAGVAGAAGLIGSRNVGAVAEYGAVAAGSMMRGIGGAGGVIGLIVSIAAGALIKSFIETTGGLEAQAQDLAILRGGSVSGVMAGTRGLNDPAVYGMGLTPGKVFEKEAQYRRAFMRGGVNTLDIAGLGIARGIDDSTLAGLLGVRRYDFERDAGTGAEVNTTTRIATFFERYIQSTGQNIAILPEILQQFTQEARAIISTQGEVQSGILAGVITSIGQMGFRGQNLSRITAGFRGGLQRQQNPVIQALQFQSLSQTKGMAGASLWDLEVAMENPLENPEYISQFLTNLRTMSGGGEMYQRAIFNTFGQHGISRRDAERIAMAPDSFFNIYKRNTEADIHKQGDINYRSEARRVTGAVTESTALFQTIREVMGVKATEKLVEAINRLMSNLMEGEFTDNIRQAVKEGTTAGMNKAKFDLPPGTSIFGAY